MKWNEKDERVQCYHKVDSKWAGRPKEEYLTACQLTLNSIFPESLTDSDKMRKLHINGLIIEKKEEFNDELEKMETIETTKV